MEKEFTLTEVQRLLKYFRNYASPDEIRSIASTGRAVPVTETRAVPGPAAGLTEQALEIKNTHRRLLGNPVKK